MTTPGVGGPAGTSFLPCRSVGAADRAMIEDMMRVATSLSELDVLFLSYAAREYQVEVTAHPQEAQRAVAARTAPGTREDQYVHFGRRVPYSRLEIGELGLATKVETGVPWEPPVFRPLEAGSRFIEYIQSSEGK